MYLLVVDGLAHADFTSYALVEGRNAVPIYWAAATPGDAARQRAVSKYVFSFLAVFLAQDTASRAFLTRAFYASVSGATLTVEHRSAVPPSIGYDDFVRAVITGRDMTATQDGGTPVAVGTSIAHYADARLSRSGAASLHRHDVSRVQRQPVGVVARGQVSASCSTPATASWPRSDF